MNQEIEIFKLTTDYKTRVKRLIAEWFLSDFDEWYRSMKNYPYYLVTNSKIKFLFPGANLNNKDGWMMLHDEIENKIEKIIESNEEKRLREKAEAEEMIKHKNQEALEILNQTIAIGKEFDLEIEVTQWVNPKFHTIARFMSVSVTVEKKIKKNVFKKEKVEIGQLHYNPFTSKMYLYEGSMLDKSTPFEKALEIFEQRKTALLNQK